MSGEETAAPGAQVVASGVVPVAARPVGRLPRFYRAGAWLAGIALTFAGLALGAILKNLEIYGWSANVKDDTTVLGIIGGVALLVGVVLQWWVARTPIPGRIEVPPHVAIASALTWWRTRLHYGAWLTPGGVVTQRIPAGEEWVTFRKKSYRVEDGARRWNPDYIPRSFLSFYREGDPQPIRTEKGRMRYTAAILHTFRGDYLPTLWQRAMNRLPAFDAKSIMMLVGALLVGAAGAYVFMQERGAS